MSATYRPRRSALYMPASNARALEKARSLACDVVILDLEDAVAPDAKETARSAAAKAVWDGGYGNRELVIRVNRLDTPWGIDDVHAAAAAGPAAILLPKVEGPAEVEHLALEMDKAGARPDVRIWCMIETPRGFLRIEDIAFAHNRLGCLVMGFADLVKDLRAEDTPDRAPLAYAMSRAVMTARAAGLDILDGMYPDFRDIAGLEAQAVQARQFGFDGKTLIHPGQIDTANAVFAPSAEAVAHARAVVAAFTAARAAGKGVATLDGVMVESLHAEVAQRLVDIADAIAARG